jgi:murein DD-endopeptidase MepM/ murein hydrolase activator NlpD
MAYVPEPGGSWGTGGRSTPAMRRTAAALALLLLFWASQRVPNPWSAWVRATVATALATGPETTTAVVRMARPVATWVAATSWGAVLDWWFRPTTSSPAGRLVATYGWHRRGGGWTFTPGDVVRVPRGVPIRAATGGRVRVGGGRIVIRSPSGLRLVYAGLGTIRVRSGDRVTPGTPVATAGTAPVQVELWVRGFPADPAPYVARMLR